MSTGAFQSWADVEAFALGLPDAEPATSYGRSAVKVRGKAFVFPSREPDSFAIRVPLPEKELLIETDGESFWETDHYRGWPTVLVRYGSGARERIENVIARAWWDRASKNQRAGFGDRP